MADPTLAIETRVLTKQYGRHTAVCDLDLHVPRGAVCGFLGRNGAGKTTTIGMLTGLLHPTRGDAWLLGHDVRRDVRAALRRTGVLLDQPAFYPNLSGRENMWVTAQALGGGAAVRIAEVLDTVDLAERAGDRVGGYSLGMKQRLGLAAALLNDPELLILDEPTAGLDPIGQRAIRTLIRRLAEETGKTIFLSSHQLHEVELICDHLAIIDRGLLKAQGPLAELAAGRDLETLFVELAGGGQEAGDGPAAD